MSQIASQIKIAFNAAADRYHQMAVLQKEIARRVNEKLNVIATQPAVIIELGAGTGLLSQHLKTRYPKAQLICLDFAKFALAHNSATHKICADAYQLPFRDQSADVIISSLMMQWCPDLDTLLQESFRVLKNDGLLLFSTFGPDTLKELKKSWAALDNQAHVNHFSDMHIIGDKLLQTGFQNPVMEMEILTLTYQNVIDLMRDLKSIGAQTVNNRAKTLTGKTKFQQMIQFYECYRKDGKLPATYEVIYGHTWKKTAEMGAIAIHNT